MDQLVVWRFIDGKAGHEAQSQGLLEALQRKVALEVHEVQVAQVHRAAWQWLLGRFPCGRDLPAPDWIIGAGHRTHLPMLAARRARGGQIVVLMRPSLPLACFDWAVVPEHDRPGVAHNLIVTQGVLNTVCRAEQASSAKGLFLLGGPSKHYRWDDAAMVEQVRRIVAQQPEVEWVLTTSRRTPALTLQGVQSLQLENLTVVPVEATAPGWVRSRLQECGRVWVSEDSISMIFEALTAGAQVGLLDVPANGKHSRVQAAVQKLKADGRVSVGQGEPIVNPALPPLAEADRVADLLLARSSGLRRPA